MTPPPLPPRPDLYAAIRDFDIDGGPADLTFAQRLARENRWPLPFAHRVVAEYKKFIYLAVAAGHPVTPSDEVDQAWHQHLVYSESYWTRLCGEILKRPLHHNPTRGGAAEAGKFDQWYSRTLESYERIFAEKPPADIWPEPSIRFNDNQRFIRVNAASHWIVPKFVDPPRLKSPALSAALLALFIATFVFGSTLYAQADQGGSEEPPALIQFGLIILQILAFFSAFIIFGFAVSALVGMTCPACQKKRALTKTGAKENRRREFRCKYCGHTLWLAAGEGGNHGSGCGFGCGGSGCGGSGCGGGGCGS